MFFIFKMFYGLERMLPINQRTNMEGPFIICECMHLFHFNFLILLTQCCYILYTIIYHIQQIFSISSSSYILRNPFL